MFFDLCLVGELFLRLGQVLLRNFALGFVVVTAESSFLLNFGVLGNLLGTAVLVAGCHSKLLSGFGIYLKNSNSMPLSVQLVLLQIPCVVLTVLEVVSEGGNLSIHGSKDSHTNAFKLVHRDWKIFKTSGVKQGFTWMHMVSQQASTFDLRKSRVHSTLPQLDQPLPPQTTSSLPQSCQPAQPAGETFQQRRDRLDRQETLPILFAPNHQQHRQQDGPYVRPNTEDDLPSLQMSSTWTSW